MWIYVLQYIARTNRLNHTDESDESHGRIWWIARTNRTNYTYESDETKSSRCILLHALTMLQSWWMHLMEAADGITAAKIYCWLSWNKPNFVSHWTKSQGWSCEGANIGKTQRWFCEEANIYRSCEGACGHKCDIMIHYQGTTKYLTA